METIRSIPRLAARAVVATAAACMLSGCVIVSGSVNPFSSSVEPLEEHVIGGSGRERIVLADITGTITSQSVGDTFGFRTRESMITRMEAVLRKASEDDRVRALVLRINSPGGSVTASDILYHDIQRFRKTTGIPVVAGISDVGASGAYYAALAADEIVAHPTSVIGSIGVLLQSVSVSGLMKKIGVSNQTISTGDMKDAGSPLRKMSEEQEKVLQSVVDDMFDRFVGLVRENRPKLTKEMDEQMRDGRVFSAEQALDGGLIDRIEYLDDTIKRVQRQRGLAQATIVTYRQPEEFVRGLYSEGGGQPVQMNLLNLAPELAPQTPRLLYQWLP